MLMNGTCMLRPIFRFVILSKRINNIERIHSSTRSSLISTWREREQRSQDLEVQQLCSGFQTPFNVTVILLREAFEAYYIDAKHHFLMEQTEVLHVGNLPLPKFRLHSRCVCAFSRRYIYLNKYFEWRRLGRWVPCDSPDLEHFSDL